MLHSVGERGALRPPAAGIQLLVGAPVGAGKERS
jgi:hypothetical protein